MNGGPGIPRDVLMGFLSGLTQNMMDESVQEHVVKASAGSNVPLQSMCTQYQRVMMEEEHGIEKEYGCRYLGRIPSTFPDDEELLKAGSEFIRSCHLFFLGCIRMRAKMRDADIPLKTSGMMETYQIHEFFEGCNALMQDPVIKKELRDIFVETSKPPNERIIALQRSVIEMIGYEADYGCKILDGLGQTHGKDQMTLMKFQEFALGAQCAAEEACMSDEERKVYYARMPIFMHPTPHMFKMQQQRQEAMMRRQQHMNSGAGGHDHSHSHDHGHAAHEQMQHLVQDPELIGKMNALQERMGAFSDEAAAVIELMSFEEKKLFVRDFVTSPVLRTMNATPDPKARLENFANMSDGDLKNLVTFQRIVATDGEKIGIKPIMRGGGGAANAQNSGGGGGILGGISNLLGMGGNRGNSHAGHHHNHSHAHSHAHATAGQAASAPGSVQTMER